MFLLELVIDHNSRMILFIDDLKAERETVWHCTNFVDGRITFKPNLFLGRKTLHYSNNNNGNFIKWIFRLYIQLQISLK